MSSLYDRIAKLTDGPGDDESTEEEKGTRPLPLDFSRVQRQIEHIQETEKSEKPQTFGNLEDRLEKDDQSSGGLTTLDIAALPGMQRKIMFAVLRNKTEAMRGITSEQLKKHLDTDEDISKVLDQLMLNDWLIGIGEPPNQRYKVNLRPRRSSTLWNSITSRLLDEL
jgi:hypothetical protein